MTSRNATSPAGEVLTQCYLIMTNPTETPQRRKLAKKWYERLSESTNGWGNDGRTVAESAGIEVDPKAPGGQRVAPPESVAVAKNEYEQGRQNRNYNGGSLSSEVSSRYRSVRWAAEKSEH